MTAIQLSSGGEALSIDRAEVTSATRTITSDQLTPLNRPISFSYDTVGIRDPFVGQHLQREQGKSSAAGIPNQISLVNGLISGACTRIAKELVLHPIETVKARVQVDERNNMNASSLAAGAVSIPVADAINSVYTRYSKVELYRGAYDGIVPSLLGGIPAGAVFFGAKDFIKSWLSEQHLFSKAERTVIAVIFANIPYWILRNPSEVLKTQDQVSKGAAGAAAKGLTRSSDDAWDRFVHTWKKRGALDAIKALYRSYASNLLYALPADVIKFVAYEGLNSIILHTDDGQRVAGLSAASTGAVASLVAQLVTTPLDVARTRIMTSGVESSDAIIDSNSSRNISSGSSNPFMVLRRIQQEEGVEGLLAGSVPRAFRAIASGAVQFATYEFTQNLLRGS